MALPVSSFDWSGALWRAQTGAGLKDDTVAVLIGVTRQRWAQMRDGSANLSLPHLSELAKDKDGRVMLEAFMAEWATYHGVASMDLVLQWLRDGMASYTRLRMQVGKARMAKASLLERAERKSA